MPIVPISQVRYSGSTRPWMPRRRDVVRMRGVLERQGQIEPLQVRQVGPDHYEVFGEDPWGNELLTAANELHWPHVLIVVMRKYEQ